MMLKPLLRLVQWFCARTFFRRRVRALLYVVLIVAVLTIQIGLLIHLLQEPSSRTGWSDGASSPELRPDFSQSPSWRLIRDIVEAARSTRLPLFSLEAGSTRRSSSDGCNHFCSGTRWQFGTIAAFSNRREPQFIEQLSARGLAIDTVRVPNPNMVELVVELTAHFVIRYRPETRLDAGVDAVTKAPALSPASSESVGDGRSSGKREEFVVHVLVFHERPDHFWWHAPVPAGHALRPHLEGLPFVDKAGAHAKVEISDGVRDGLRLLVPSTSFSASAVEFIDCNRSRAEEFFTKNGGRDSSPNSELFRIRVRKLLVKVKALLAKHRIPFWLSSGTCLGWFRQCDVIPYTTDVDIGVFIEDFSPVLIDEFSTHDLALTHVFGHPKDSYELSFLDVAEQLKLDVFFFYREHNHTWNGGTQARTGHKYKYIFPPFSMCLTEFLDLLVQVPCPTLPYIEANYGPDWRLPIRQWDWKRSPPNVRENGVWPMDQWSRLIQLFPLPPY